MAPASRADGHRQSVRILVLNSEFPPFGGGASTMTLALLESLKDDPHVSIDLVTSGAKRVEEVEQFAERIRIFRVPAKNPARTSFSGLELLRYSYAAYRLARRLHREKPYALSMSWSAVPAGFVSYLLRRSCRLPYILRIMGAEIPGYEMRYRLLYPILTPVIRRVWNSADRVIVKCEKEAEQVRAIDPKLPLRLIPNGVLRGGELRWPREPLAVLRILCVGRLVERKRQADLIAAASLLRDRGIPISVDFLGDGYAQDAYMHLIQKHQLQDYAHLHGHVPRAEMPTWYENADVFVLPSYNEGMSVAVLEAMASGLPLVITHEANGGDLVMPGVNGFLFHSGDVRALADHLQMLALDRKLVREMARSSAERSRLFDWTAAAEEYRTLFRSYALRGAPQTFLSPVSPSEKIPADGSPIAEADAALPRPDLLHPTVGRSAGNV